MLAGSGTEACVLPGGISHAMAEVMRTGWSVQRAGLQVRLEESGDCNKVTYFTPATFRGGAERSRE